MADVAASFANWSSTDSSNSPAGTVNVGPGLDDNLRAIQGGIVRGVSHKGADIASASTVDLAAVEGFLHYITGTTGITSYGTGREGLHKILKFAGALTITHNAASMILLGGEDRTTAAGDMQWVISEGSGNWREVSYFPAAINPGKMVSTDESQTLTNKILTSPTIQGTVAAGSGLTLPALTLGGTVTLNGQSFSGTCANGGTFTTIDINGGTIDGVTIGGSSAAAATVTTLTASGLIKREAAGAVAIIANSTDAGTTAAAGGSFSFQSNGTYNGTFGSYATVTGAGTNQSVMLQAHTNDVYVNAATAGKHIYGQIGGATVTDTSSSGLAVTGTLSATASGQKILNLVSTDPTGGYIAILRGATANAIIGAYSAASGGGTTINADALFLRGFQGIGFGGGSAAVDVFLDTSGNLLVGTTSATDTSKLHVYHTGATQPAALLKNDAGSGAPTAGVWNSATSGDNSFVNFYSDAGATLRGSIDYNRAGGAVRYNTSSDARLKLDLGIVISTDILRSTIIHDFQWKGTEARARGVFAQEAYLVNPNAVKKGDDGDTVKEMWQVDYSKYVPDLIVGWQQHERDITAVKSALSQLGVTLQ